MAIICCPKGVEHGGVVPCALCSRNIPLAEASAGLYFYDGRQAFACSEHFYSTSELITGWTNFVLKQRQATLLHVGSTGHESRVY